SIWFCYTFFAHGDVTEQLDAVGRANYVARDFEAGSGSQADRARRLRWPAISGQAKAARDGVREPVAATKSWSDAGASSKPHLRRDCRNAPRGRTPRLRVLRATARHSSFPANSSPG